MDISLFGRAKRLSETMTRCALVCAAFLAPLASPARADDTFSTGIFVGVDFDQDSAGGKDQAKKIGDKFGHQGKWSVSHITKADGKPKDLCDTIKTKLGADYDSATNKIKCDGKVFFLYISAHGDYTFDPGEQDKPNPKGETSVFYPGATANEAAKLSDLFTWVAGAIPECCDVVFAVDVCATFVTWNKYAARTGQDANPNNPFHKANNNYQLLMPSATGAFCLGSPVADGINKQFGKARNFAEYGDALGKEPGVQTDNEYDAVHEKYKITTVPEPGVLPFGLTILGALSLPLFRNRRKMR